MQTWHAVLVGAAMIAGAIVFRLDAPTAEVRHADLHDVARGSSWRTTDSDLFVP